MAEAEVTRLFPQRHLILRPGVVYAADAPGRRLAAAPILLAAAALGPGLAGKIPLLRHSCPATDAADIGMCVARMAMQGGTKDDGDQFPWGTLTSQEIGEWAARWRKEGAQ